MRAYVDSDVLIWHLPGELRASRLFRSLAAEGYELWTGAMQRPADLLHAAAQERVPPCPRLPA
jgi:hypothetical protein